MNLEQVRFKGGRLAINWSILEVKGPDSAAFLHGQTTVNIKKMQEGESKLAALVDLAGKFEAYFLVLKISSAFYLFVPPELSAQVINRFQKYIIMEDVEVLRLTNSYSIVLGPVAKKRADGYLVKFFGEEGRIIFDKIDLEEPEIDEKTLNELCVLSGFPRLHHELDTGILFSETILSKLAFEPDKGCFLGQETVSKIENFRGPAYYPVLLIFETEIEVKNGQEFVCENRKGGSFRSSFKDDGKTFAYTYLFRDFRIDQIQLKIQFNEQEFITQVNYYPFLKMDDLSKVQELIALASNEYTQNNNLSRAKEYLLSAIEIKPDYADAYESLGVLYGHEGKFQEAINLMEKLETIDPKSVMANTNKSLYLMKLGKITEAEEEKNKATLKSFSYYGDQAKAKQFQLDEKEKQEKENIRRESMFKQVLEIDGEDEMALYGMAEIFYHRGKNQDAITNLQKVLVNNPKYSVAYLLLGKCFEQNQERSQAILTYQTGIKIAANKGDMMPANEMQSRLTKLTL